MTSIVCVVSGGMDSVTLLHLAKQQFDKVQALTVDYGQKHAREIEAAHWQVRELGIPWTLVDLTPLSALISRSALTGEQSVPDGRYDDKVQALTVVPNRNMILASVAIAKAVNDEYDWIGMGLHSGDHAIYPDCRPQFVEALIQIADIANYHPVGIWTPFLHRDKGEIVNIGTELGVNYAHTWTCYKGRGKACGKCGSCTERLEAFENNGLIDPVEYE